MMNSVERLHEMTMTRELAARADAVSEEKRTAELTFSSEKPYKRWFGLEILDHSENSVDLTRLQEIGVLLFNHEPDHPIGRVEKVWIGDDSRGHALVKFDADEESDRIFKKVSGGSLRGVSVGYRINEYTQLKEGETSKDGRFKGPAVIVSQWEPLEISIVSVPADAGVGVGRSIEDLKGMNKDMDKKPEMKNQTEMKKDMDVKKDIQNAIEQERTRNAEITKLCRSFEMSPDDYIEKGLTLEEARAEVLKELAKKSAPVSVNVLSDESEKFRAAAADGLAMRAGIEISTPADGAESFRGVSLMRLAYDICEREGGKPSRMDNDTLLRSVFSGGSGAFPNILSNVGHKALMKGYNEVPATFQYWTSKGSNPDFKPSTRVGLGAADELLPMTEMGEFKSSETTDMGLRVFIGCKSAIVSTSTVEPARFEQLATQACLPPRTLARAFQRELGTTPARYVERVRLEAATALLSQRQSSVATVARLCGFGHPETLRRSFQRHLAFSPQAFAERFGTG